MTFLKYFPDDHTGENLSQGLRDALASWGLCEEQQVSITNDNGSNIVKAVALKKTGQDYNALDIDCILQSVSFIT